MIHITTTNTKHRDIKPSISISRSRKRIIIVEQDTETRIDCDDADEWDVLVETYKGKKKEGYLIAEFY